MQRVTSVRVSRRSMFLTPATAALAAQGEKAPRSSGTWMPKLADNIGLNPAGLRWLRQLGCRHVFTTIPDREKKGHLSTADIQGAKKLCQDADLTLEVSQIPLQHYLLAVLGRPGRDEQIENVCKTIRAAGEAGVPIWKWTFWPDWYWDERVGYYSVEARGGSIQRAFDYGRVPNGAYEEFGPATEKEMWERVLYFGKPVVEAAQKAGVRLAMHPNDPPVPIMHEFARIFPRPEGLLRFLKEIPSPASGISFCQGVFTEMGVDVLAEIRRFGRMNKIHLVEFRTVRGKVPRYTEVFLDEGEVNMIQAMRAYKEVGYTGPMITDHTPVVEGDTGGRGFVGRSFSLGYMRAAVQAVNTL